MAKVKRIAEDYYKGENLLKPMKPKKFEEPSTWAKSAWTGAKALGICDGTRPKDTVTREEVVTMLMQTLHIAKGE